MELYLIRHGIAIDRGDPDCPAEEERYLTEKGVTRMRGIAEALVKLDVRLDRMLSSPYVRARETAELVLEQQGELELELSEVFTPGGDPEEGVNRLRAASQGASALAVTGHEPNMSRLISTLLTGDDQMNVRMKKGGVCRIDIEWRRDGWLPELRWLMAPRQLLAIVSNNVGEV